MLTSLPQSHGFQTFTFTLSIPYYNLNRGRQLTDARRWLNGELLRKAVAIPILGKSRRASAAANAVEELYEAQITITMTGIDEERWTAIGLIDSTCATASVRQYSAELLLDGGQREDPVAGKKLGPDNHAFNPRLYFLWVWEARIAQADTEWDGILARIDRTVTK